MYKTTNNNLGPVYIRCVINLQTQAQPRNEYKLNNAEKGSIIYSKIKYVVTLTMQLQVKCLRLQLDHCCAAYARAVR